MENFEEVLKRELKPLKEEVGILNNKVGSLENKIENLETKTDGLKKDISEFKDEMRKKLFVFENDYGKKLDVIYDKVILNEELTKEKLTEIKKNVKKNEMRAFDNSVQISSIKNQNTSSNF